MNEKGDIAIKTLCIKILAEAATKLVVMSLEFWPRNLVESPESRMLHTMEISNDDKHIGGSITSIYTSGGSSGRAVGALAPPYRNAKLFLSSS